MNPFITIATIAIAAILAGAGAVAVPGWIDSANDAKVTNDISQAAIAEEAAYTVFGDYLGKTDLLTGDEPGAGTEKSGVKFQPSEGVKYDVKVNGAGDEWAYVGVSESGRIFIRTSASATIGKPAGNAAATAAIDAALGADWNLTFAADGTPTLTGGA